MPQGLFSKFRLPLFWLCLLTVTLHTKMSWAHMLNMTRVDVRVNETGTAKVLINIDLGQSLMSAEDYWAASQMPAIEQARAINESLNRINREMVVLLDGEPVALQLVKADLAAISLEAISNPLTPQMATLHYEMDTSGAGSVQLQMLPELEVPWPLLLKIELGGYLPQSRLLTEVDRLSLPAAIKPEFLPASKNHQAIWLVDGWVDPMPWMTWIAVGFQHIIPRGLDHILFILGLFLVCKGWRSLLVQVTGFTLAHSLTLGLSTYGLISVPGSVVEPLIALSIVYVALDNSLGPKLVRWRFVIVCLFGLLHGLGFASVLSDIGLPSDQFLLSLALFNLGVELGQLAVLLAAFLIVVWFRRQTWFQSVVVQPSTIAIAGTGMYWFLKRVAF